MISNNELERLYPRVEKAIVQLYNLAKQNQGNPGDFLLYLENGHLSSHKIPGYSRHSIGQGISGVNDQDRKELFRMYTRTPYEENYKKANDRADKENIVKHSLHQELMIYTHAWESFPNLKMLKQLENLVQNGKYRWEINVPDFKRHDFIRGIRDNFKTKELEIANLLSESYHSQLQNAFAHSEYSFSLRNDKGRIHLGNYDAEKKWMLEFIDLVDWRKRFQTTMLLFDTLEALKLYYKDLHYKTGSSMAVWFPYPKFERLTYLDYDPIYKILRFRRKIE